MGATEPGSAFTLLMYTHLGTLDRVFYGGHCIPREDAGTHLNHFFACLKTTRGQIT